MASILKIKDNQGNWKEIQTIVGSKGEKGDNGNDYVITQQDYQAIANIVESEISIPTKTSELTNDSGYLTEHNSFYYSLDLGMAYANLRLSNSYSHTYILNFINDYIKYGKEKIYKIKSGFLTNFTISNTGNYRKLTLTFSVDTSNGENVYIKSSCYSEGEIKLKQTSSTVIVYVNSEEYEAGQVQNVYSDTYMNKDDVYITRKGQIQSFYEPQNILSINNTKSYTPSNDYNPASKKYVDDKVSTEIGNINTILATLTTVEEVE